MPDKTKKLSDRNSLILLAAYHFPVFQTKARALRRALRDSRVTGKRLANETMN